jgi:hypothetical protein
MHCFDTNLQVLELLLRPFEVQLPIRNSRDSDTEVHGADFVHKNEQTERPTSSSLPTNPADFAGVNWAWYKADGMEDKSECSSQHDRTSKHGVEIYNHWQQVQSCPLPLLLIPHRPALPIMLSYRPILVLPIITNTAHRHQVFFHLCLDWSAAAAAARNSIHGVCVCVCACVCVCLLVCVCACVCVCV